MQVWWLHHWMYNSVITCIHVGTCIMAYTRTRLKITAQPFSNSFSLAEPQDLALSLRLLFTESTLHTLVMSRDPELNYWHMSKTVGTPIKRPKKAEFTYHYVISVELVSLMYTSTIFHSIFLNSFF